MKKIQEVEMPINSNERFLHAIAVRLEVLIDQVGALSEHIAKRDNVGVESGKVEGKTPAKKRTVKKKAE